MQSFTKNESRVIDLLIRNFREKNSINEIGRRLSLSARGAYKILKKFESEGIVKPKAISNIISYKLDFSNIKTARILFLLSSRYLVFGKM